MTVVRGGGGNGGKAGGREGLHPGRARKRVVFRGGHGRMPPKCGVSLRFIGALRAQNQGLRVWRPADGFFLEGLR